MANVVRFTLPTARTLALPGVGLFRAGVLDVDANDLNAVSRARYLSKPYGAVEVGTVDSATAAPTLPAVPGPANPDPYPQYVTDQDLSNSASGPMVVLRAASVSAVAGFRREFPITEYGAERSAYLTGASMTAGSPILAVSGYSFQTSDVGKVVGVRGAGTVSTDYGTVANDGVLVGTIASVSGGQATLNVNAVTTCSGVPCVFGKPIDTALTAAIAACTAAGGGTVYLPAGDWVAQASAPYSSRVSFAGAGRGNTRVYVTKVVPSATDVAAAAWLRTTGAGAGGRYVEVNLSDFTADGSFFASSGAYGADMKMIHVSGTADSTVERIATINNPSTAIGYDESINCLIANNIVLNPGRLATAGPPNGSPGGSGIGVAVGGRGDLSMVIRDNFIKGLWTSAGGTGRAGINVEASSSSTAPASYAGGLHVVNNYIEGFYNGLVDSGAVGTVVSGNHFRACTNGVKLGTNGIATGFIGRDTVITSNVIEDSVSGDTFTGVGILVTSTGSTQDTDGRTLIADNVIKDSSGYGVQINGGNQPIRNVTVRGNAIRDCARNGIRVTGTIYDLAITDNSISGNGSSGLTGATQAINVASGTWTGGRLENNDFTDYKAVPTQVNSYVTSGATLSGVRVRGNTGDDAQGYASKTSTTTINNNATLATVSAFSLPLEANSTYSAESIVEYSTDVAAGLKIRWNVPTGTSFRWTVRGAGTPDEPVRAATDSVVLTGTGVGVLRTAVVQGFITTGATPGSLTLSAAQSVATATDSTVTTRTTMTLRKIVNN